VSHVSNGEAPGVDAAAAEDARIVGRMAQGDGSALAALYDRHARLVYSLSRRILGDPHDAEDVAQEVFAQAWAQAGRYDAGRAPVVTWLLVITRGRAIDRLRTRRGRAVRPPDAVPWDIPDPAPGQEAGAITAEQVGRLRSALAGLGDAQRRAIELAYFDDLSQSEIAARLQEPLGTIKTRLRSGLLKLRAALEPE
jgi:RNA polymerase sigma-70 factor (ECF subfamily)